MTVAEYIVDFLISKGVTDVFGLPGGVVLELLYAMDKRREELSVHLNYHEQSAAFAAIGYAQASGTLGVAYSTRGPGFTNLLTGVAEAYCDSIPVLFITAHEQTRTQKGMRNEYEQELDTISIASSITKYARRIERVDDVARCLIEAYDAAVCERKGAVLLDFNSSIFRKDMIDACPLRLENVLIETNELETIRDNIIDMISEASRPVLLIGDGIKQASQIEEVRRFAELNKLPVVSSRFAEDIMPDSEVYYGYIGSHGIRHANFILSKADLVIAMGNRMAFPLNSMSYQRTMENKKVIRVEVDKSEFERKIPNCINYNVDISKLLPLLLLKRVRKNTTKWISVCNELKYELCCYDIIEPVKHIADTLALIDDMHSIVCDVGNNEYWMSQAYLFAKKKNRIIYSKSFGSLGCALGKAIGVYYATRKKVYCFIGDQGFQLNIQELQFIVQHKLPICIIVLNNNSSGMIRSREKNRFGYYLLTTLNSGYSTPEFKKIADAYGLPYYTDIRNDTNTPYIVEMIFDEEYDISPNLPKGHVIQELSPMIEREKYDYLNGL